MAHFGPRWDIPLAGNLGQLGDKLEPSWRQDGPTWNLNCRLGAILGGILDDFFGSWACFLQNWPKCKIEQHYSVLARNWGSWGVSWSLLGLSCAILTISWAVLGNLGAMLGHFWQHVGAKMPNMSQDGRTWVQKGWLKALRYARYGAAVGV